MARTIDNLGVDSSTRYAEDQQRLDPNFVKELRRPPVQPQVDVTEAFYSSELDALLETHELALPWATFQAPKGYFEQTKGLFAVQLMSILGSDEKLEAEMERIEANIRNLMVNRKKKEDEKEGDVMKWEAGQEEEDEEKEKESLLSLLQCITLLDRLLSDINGRRNQYQKG